MKNNLIIGGASKSGTTALYYYLRQHPEVCLSEKKELHYFSRKYLEKYTNGPGDKYVIAEIPNTYDAFLDSFAHCANHKLRIDISPSYLFHYKSADEIVKKVGKVKAVFILRNPVDKIYSQYMHLVGEGRETLNFNDALEIEKIRESQGFSDMWLYRKSGKYSHAIEYFQQTLGKENVRVFLYDEFLRDQNAVLKDICEFSNIDNNIDFSPIQSVNRSGIPKSEIIAKIMAPNFFTYILRKILPKNFGRVARNMLKNLNTGEKGELSKELRFTLISEFTDDIRNVEKLIGKETGWLNTKSSTHLKTFNSMSSNEKL